MIQNKRCKHVKMIAQMSPQPMSANLTMKVMSLAKQEKANHFTRNWIHDLFTSRCLVKKHIAPCSSEKHPFKSERFRFAYYSTDES